MSKKIRISDIIIPKYYDIFNDRTYRHIILTSGRAGSKSSYAGIRAIYQTVGKEASASVVLRKHHNKLRKTVYKEMIRAMGRLGISKNKFEIKKSPMEICYRKNGNTIYFTGSDGIDNTKGIIDEDKPIRLVILDELTEFFDDGEGEDELSNIEATFIRGNSGGFQMIYIYNPPKNPNAPINKWCKKMEKRSDCIHIHTDYRDVPKEWLGSDLIESAKELEKTDPKKYRWVWLGEAIGVDEMIYYMFSQEHIVEPPKDRIYHKVIIGGDYGQQNATTYQAFGIDEYNKKFRGLNEFYHSGREEGKQKTPSEYADECVKLMNDIYHEYYCEEIDAEGFFVFVDNNMELMRFDIYLDPSAKGLQEEIKRKTKNIEEYRVYIHNAQNDVALGIGRVQKVLSYNIMSLSPQQEYAKEEIEVYQYDKKSIEHGREQPVKEKDHCMDAIRYAVMGGWKILKKWLPETDEEKRGG